MFFITLIVREEDNLKRRHLFFPVSYRAMSSDGLRHSNSLVQERNARNPTEYMRQYMRHYRQRIKQNPIRHQLYRERQRIHEKKSKEKKLLSRKWTLFLTLQRKRVSLIVLYILLCILTQVKITVEVSVLLLFCIPVSYHCAMDSFGQICGASSVPVDTRSAKQTYMQQYMREYRRRMKENPARHQRYRDQQRKHMKTYLEKQKLVKRNVFKVNVDWILVCDLSVL